MAAGPAQGRFDDPRLAESLRVGDVIALSEVYDAYAPLLFDYCHGLLRDRVEAAGALRNVMVSAREHVGGLRTPERLRGWLYALARKESLRRRDSPSRHVGQEAAEVDDGELSEEQFKRREERRMLALSALAALSGRQREAIDLAARHELDAVDLAGVFGESAEEMAVLLGEAEATLEAAVRAALVARNHWEDCPSLSALTESWPLSRQSARSVMRHVAGCPTCGERDTPRLPADRLLAVLPVAALPADLRLDVLGAATDPERADNRRAVAAWAEPFDERGWPLPYQPAASRARERESPRRRGPVLAALAAAVAAVVLIGGSVAAFTGGDSDSPGGASALPSGGSSSSSSSGGDPSQPAGAPSVKASATVGSASPSPAGSSASPSASASPSKSPTQAATATPSRTRAPASRSPEPDRPRTPQQGRLAITGCDMDRDEACTVTIRAVGGPVDWAVTGTSGELSASGSGHLEAGDKAEVRVSRTNGWCWSEKTGSVSFSPSATASVTYC
ncbi:sigma-70 family RNA polymerase sigma factor [Actinomadura keratinilytica]|uniref:Sigma-70 family RNA polymerase sigma factor n=1 Tax=Actinomadura keratinilytica TaxID=547461 RepID=A0ABP7ZDX6_9ACTN